MVDGRASVARRGPAATGVGHEGGQAIVELALCVTLFFLLFFGVMDVAFKIYNYHFVDYAARAATRYAIVRGSSSPMPASATDIQAFVFALGLDRKAVSVTTTWIPDNAPGSLVRVEVKYDLQSLVPFVSSTTVALASSSQMVISQ
jgi:Flp pilus assembly protein TadG